MNSYEARWRSVFLILFMLEFVLLVGYYTGKIQDAEDKSIWDYMQLKERCDELEVAYISKSAQADCLDTALTYASAQLNIIYNPINYDSDPAPLYDIALSDDLQQYTYNMCRYYGIVDSYELALAIMWKESDFNATKISSTNDYGLMQINIQNHKWLKEYLRVDDMLDEKDNIESGVYILSTLIDKYYDIDKVLMVYNMGPSGAAEQWDRGNCTSTYTLEVKEKLNLLKRKDIYKEINNKY